MSEAYRRDGTTVSTTRKSRPGQEPEAASRDSEDLAELQFREGKRAIPVTTIRRRKGKNQKAAGKKGKKGKDRREGDDL